MSLNILKYNKGGIAKVFSLALKNEIYWSELETSRTESLQKWKKKNHLQVKTLINRVLHEAERSELYLDETCFQVYQKHRVPMLRLFPVLNEPLEKDAKAMVLELFRNQEALPKIRYVLENLTELNDKDMCFRMDNHCGRPTIFGNNLPLLKSVTSLAHELGHAIVELSMIRSIEKQRHSLVGEVLAHCLEKLAGMYLLNNKPKLQNQWLQWCDRVDATNFLFFLQENEAVDRFKISKVSFLPQSLVLRQSYYCSPGFQFNNAYASYLRRRIVYS